MIAAPSSTQQSERLVRLATYVAVGVAFVLISLKAYGWWYTHSVSLLSSLIDSGVDSLASIINMFAVRGALKPADYDHRFGHSKAEALAALGQSVVIIGSAFVLFYHSFQQLNDPQPLHSPPLGMGIMVVATVLTIGLVRFQSYVIKRTKSLVIQADSLHYRSDLLMNLGVIAALALSHWFDLPWLDGGFGVVIGIYILYTAWLIIKEALDILMDRELPDNLRNEIKSLVLGHPQVMGVHDLRTRSAGARHFVQLHLEIDGNLSLFQAHTIAQEVENAIIDKLPNTEVLIHEDPR